jgi:FdhE protein
MNRENWIARHPYLRPIAEFQGQVETAAASLPAAFASIPEWRDYAEEFRAGVPLLGSSNCLVDLRPVPTILRSLVEKLARTSLPDQPAEEIRNLETRLAGDPSAPEHAVAWLVEENPPPPPHSGMLRYVGWTVLARYLSRVVGQFGAWREEEQWLRSYCPTCGSLPAMAQLAGAESRMRHLSCGCCGTRWLFRRTGCPFCENRDDHRLAVVAIEGEEGLRIDYCESCSGYLKTYAGTGSESLLLADWTSLHLDIIAGDRGWKRLAASLYSL